jgi:hypothetical protein
LLEDLGLRSRLAEDSQPYLRWAYERPARGWAACPQAAAERLHARFPEIRFAKRFGAMSHSLRHESSLPFPCSQLFAAPRISVARGPFPAHIFRHHGAHPNRGPAPPYPPQSP